MSSIKDNINRIYADITTVKKENNLKKDICLIAVTKSQPVERIEELIKLGHKSFAENRVQESIEKWYYLKKKYSNIKLHMIGHLQTNKVKEAVSLFDSIQAVDSFKLVDLLVVEIFKQKKNLPCYIQVNIGKEKQKSGVFPEQLQEMLYYCNNKGLKIEGLMCIPPAEKDSSMFFKKLFLLAQDNNIQSLSMGMSNDYKLAVKHGATHLRIGRAIFM